MKAKPFPIGNFNLFDFPISSEKRRNFEPTEACLAAEKDLDQRKTQEEDDIQFLDNLLRGRRVPLIILERKKNVFPKSYIVHAGFYYIQVIQKFLSGIIPIPLSFSDIQAFVGYRSPYYAQYKGQEILGQCTFLPENKRIELWSMKYPVYFLE